MQSVGPEVGFSPLRGDNTDSTTSLQDTPLWTTRRSDSVAEIFSSQRPALTTLLTRFPPLGSKYELNSIVGISPSRRFKFIAGISHTWRQLANTTVGQTRTRELHTKPVPDILESKQTLRADIRFQTKQSQGKIQTNFHFKKLLLLLQSFPITFVQIHTRLHLTKVIRDLSHICVCFFEKKQIIQSYSYGLANQASNAKANKDLQVGECFTQAQSYCSRRIP